MKQRFNILALAAFGGMLLAVAALACAAPDDAVSGRDLAAVQDRAAANESSLRQLAARVGELEAGADADAAANDTAYAATAELSARLDALSRELEQAQTDLARLSMEMRTLAERPALPSDVEGQNAEGQNGQKVEGQSAEGGTEAGSSSRFTRENATAGQRANVEKAIACAGEYYAHIKDPATKLTILKAVEESAWLLASLTQDDAELERIAGLICNRQLEGLLSMMGSGGGLPLPSIPGGAAFSTEPGTEPRFDRNSATPEQRALIMATIQCNREKGAALPPGVIADIFADLVWQSAAMTADDTELRMMALLACADGVGL